MAFVFDRVFTMRSPFQAIIIVYYSQFIPQEPGMMAWEPSKIQLKTTFAHLDSDAQN